MNNFYDYDHVYDFDYTESFFNALKNGYSLFTNNINIYYSNSKCFYFRLGDFYHRENDLPAVIENNYTAWYNQGKFHRAHGPSQITKSDMPNANANSSVYRVYRLYNHFIGKQKYKCTVL